MPKKDLTPSPLWEINNALDNLLLKQSAWIETLGYIIDGMDQDGTAAGQSVGNAAQFASRYPAYSEMLFLILDGLHTCEDTLAALQERLEQEVTA